MLSVCPIHKVWEMVWGHRDTKQFSEAQFTDTYMRHPVTISIAQSVMLLNSLRPSDAYMRQ